MTYTRYAIYYAPDPGPLADFGAAWLGWNIATGRAVAHPDIGPLPRPVEEITRTPRKYGLHATIKPPFRLADGTSPEELEAETRRLCGCLRPADLPGLHLARIKQFLALVPQGDTGPLSELAAAVVRGLDRFRAPAGEAELSRRRAAGLSPAQETLLTTWGYPYVMEEFRFHITLSGRLPPEELVQVESRLTPVVTPMLKQPMRVSSLCIAGERTDGRFEILTRLPVT
ncbi:phosphonate metabolism protein [Primorskyibacter flagellatus]|uniref:Phosphonate metabolism protein n=1 Tax=Primorskyibacter flagellatus TaxID=1387277 RepID=A0A916ZZQ5_9RHOB|nr:DUF1045 domain-containing protein [Primorskyibacter flagellatus]GGE20231.1 phosphonate metabolism protein [Primorskyibacter flagellatus]